MNRSTNKFHCDLRHAQRCGERVLRVFPMTSETAGSIAAAWNIFESLGGDRDHGICEEFKVGLRISQRTLNGDLVLVIDAGIDGTYNLKNKWKLFRDGTKINESSE